MLLSNILITDAGAKAADDLSPIVQQNVASFRALHQGHDYRLFFEQDLIDLIRDKFPPRVLEAYYGLKPYAYRADLARYCLLYEYGGLYSDLSYFFVAPVPMTADRLTVFRGNLVSSPWDTDNSLIFAQPRHKVFECAIDLVCANVERRYYGSTSLCPTGPVVWGKALAITCEAEEILSGFGSLQARSRIQRMVPGIALPEGEHIHTHRLKDELIVVKRKPYKSPGLTDLGIAGGNNYRIMWRDRDVYA